MPGNSLYALADTLHTKADELREFAGLLDPHQMYEGSALDSQVTELVMRVLNTSSLTGAASTAIYSANRAVRMSEDKRRHLSVVPDPPVPPKCMYAGGRLLCGRAGHQYGRRVRLLHEPWFSPHGAGPGAAGPRRRGRPVTPRKTNADREWCAYTRVSKLNGREGDSFVSVDQQKRAIESAVPGRVVKVFDKDLDVSGTHMRRDDLIAAKAWVLEDPKRRGFAVMDSSRLARNLKEAFEFIDELTAAGAGFLSVHEQMDSTTPEGRLALQNMAAIHEFYSRNIGRRWRMVQSDRLRRACRLAAPSGSATWSRRPRTAR